MISTNYLLFLFFLQAIFFSNVLSQSINQKPHFSKTSFLIRGNAEENKNYHDLKVQHPRIREDGSIINKSPPQQQISSQAISSTKDFKPISDQKTTSKKTSKRNNQNNQEKDKDIDIIVDPLIYSSYFAGSNHDYINSFSVGASTDSYTFVLVGQTNSKDFPKKNQISNVAPPIRDLDYITFITRFDSNGNIIFSTYFGGSSEKKKGSSYVNISPQFSFRDSNGRFWISGDTNTPDIPITKNALQTELFNINTAGFILSLNNDGNSILYSSLIGSENNTYTSLTHVQCLIIDNDEYLIIGGSTNCSTKIYKNELQSKDPSTYFMYLYLGILHIHPTNTELNFGTVFGGSGKEVLNSLVCFQEVGGNYSIWATGKTNSTDFFKNYKKQLNPGVNPIIKNFTGNENMGFFLKIIFHLKDESIDVLPRLTAASFIGDRYNDEALWIQHDLTKVVDGKYKGDIYISGYTRNFDTFPNDPIKPTWMTYTENNGRTQVGFLIAVNQEGTNFTLSFLTGCVDSTTQLFYNFPHHDHSSFLSGYSNCTAESLGLTNDIWNEISPNNDSLEDFNLKFFMINVNLTRLTEGSHFWDYGDVIYYSSFVDGIDNYDILNNNPLVKTDLSGNFYSIFNIFTEKPYKNQFWTDNAFMVETVGETSVIMRVYGGFSCNPGSIKTENDLCISCSQGQYSNVTNSEECILCDSGYYQDETGSTSCKKCPNDTISQKGQTKCVSKEAPAQVSLFHKNVTYQSILVCWQYTEKQYDYQLSIDRPVGLELLFIVKDPEQIIIDNHEYFSFNLSGLMSNSRYYLMLRVKESGSNYFSSWSSELIVTTLGVPNRIHKQDVSCTGKEPYSIHLEWVPSPNDTSEPHGYEIEYRVKDNNNKTNERYKVSSVKQEITLIQLEPDSEYEIKIIPINDAGSGFASIPKICATYSKIPSSVNLLNISSERDSLTFSWLDPDCNGKKIDFYTIRYRQYLSDDLLTDNIHLVNQYTLAGLQSNTKYEITIVAHNDIGFSNDNYLQLTTLNNFLSYRWQIITFSIGGFCFLLILIFFFLWGTKKRRARYNKKVKIKSLIKSLQNKFNSRFAMELFCNQDTVTFEIIKKKNLLKTISQDIQLNHLIYFDNNCVIHSPELKNGLAFCKIASLLEVEIHQKLWNLFSKNPLGVPVIQYLCSMNLQNIKYNKKDNIGINENEGGDGVGNEFEKQNRYTNLQNINSEYNDYKPISKNIYKNKNKNKNKDKNKNKNKFGDDDNDDDDDVGNDQTHKFGSLQLLVLEYHPVTLHDFNIERQKIKMQFSLKEKTWILFNLISSLKVIHSQSIIHRDIKPQNILIGTDGYLRISDFSSAIIIPKGKNYIRSNFVGTQNFFDPETINTQDNSSSIITYKYQKSHDIYSLGKTLLSFSWDKDDLSFGNDLDSIPEFEQPLLKTEFNLKNSFSNDDPEYLFKETIRKCLLPINERIGVNEIFNFVKKNFKKFK
ncbi:ovarian-specific serine/threonine-protein kinase lok-related [Anaeramoeba flamelloides]|uniref:Ovarian-specific serine/threonine-protein kinase lok-related n=1 Tax=Anaeramoeba flamelloides TaxID=1746091 RepID=A0AAV7ZQL4_9EUKA|nr:ovarian-specific serine/threonine-protein kinase lok-related [Anaeramoeba flamelloides]